MKRNLKKSLLTSVSRAAKQQKIKRVLRTIKPGDVIGFSGRNWISAGINIGTFGLPSWGISHVGIASFDSGSIASYDDNVLAMQKELSSKYGKPLSRLSTMYMAGIKAGPGPRLFESTSKTGVRSIDLAKAVREYDGRVWVYPLSRPLFLNEMARLTDTATSLVGTSYDVSGAIHSGGLLVQLLSALVRGEDLTSLFCAEFAASQLSHIGVFPTSNASRWSPNHFVRKLRRMGIVNRPVRLK